MSEWQPIETAPCDETTFIAYIPGRGEYQCQKLESGIGYYLAWRDINSGEFNCFWPTVRPTHWKPQPAPPSAA